MELCCPFGFVHTMPIVKRSIFHAQCYASPDLYADTTPDSALVDVNMARMTGVLHQLGFLSTYATEMFDDLFKMAKDVTDRTKKVSARVKDAQEQLPGMEQWLDGAPARDEGGGPVFHVPSGKLERDDQAEMQQFQQQYQITEQAGSTALHGLPWKLATADLISSCSIYLWPLYITAP